MIKTLTTSILLLFVAPLLLTAAEQNRIRYTSEDVHTVQDRQTLSGDANRSYLNITEVNIREKTDRTSVTVTVAGAFPNQEFLFGTGFRFDICVYEQTPAETQVMKPDAKISIPFDSRGWRYHLFKGDSEQTEAYELRFEASSSSFTINFPSQLLLNAELLTVEATTADFPKWKPVTSHNPIGIQLQRNPGNESH